MLRPDETHRPEPEGGRLKKRDTFGDRKVGDDTLARDRRDPDNYPRQHWSDFMSGQFPDAGTEAGGLLPAPPVKGRVRGSTKLGG